VIAATAAAGQPVYLVANNKAVARAFHDGDHVAQAIIDEIRKKAAG